MLGNGNRSKEGWRQWNGQDLRAASRVQWPVERMRGSALNGTKYGGWPRSAWKSIPPQNLWVRTQTVTAWTWDSEGRVNCIKLRTSGWFSGEMIRTAIWGSWFCYEWLRVNTTTWGIWRYLEIPSSASDWICLLSSIWCWISCITPVSVFPHSPTKDEMTTILVNQTKPVIITASSLCVACMSIRSWLFLLLLPILAGSLLWV